MTRLVLDPDPHRPVGGLAASMVGQRPRPREGRVILELPMDAGIAGQLIGLAGRLGFALTAASSDDPEPGAESSDEEILQESMVESRERVGVEEALRVARRYVHNDGEAHKQYALFEIIRFLGGEVPEGVDQGLPA